MKVYFTLLLGIILSCMVPVMAQAEQELYVPRSLLEVSSEVRLLSFKTETLRPFQAFEFTVKFGLDWQKWRYVSIHGLLQTGFVAAVDDQFENSTYNHRYEQQVLPALGLMAIVDVHPQSRIIAFWAAVRSGFVMAPRRTGIFSCDLGAGFMARPFDVRREKLLRSAGFGVMLWFPAYDEFEKVFALEQDLFNLAISFSLEF